MEEKAKHLLTTIQQLNNAKNQLKTLKSDYSKTSEIVVKASRKSLEKGIKYNSPLEEGSEYLDVPRHIYVETLELCILHYEREAEKTNREIAEEFKS